MNTLRLIAIALPVMMLMACGGGGSGGGTAAAPTTPPTNMPGTGDPMTPGTGDPMNPPIITPTVMPEPLPAWRITDISVAQTRTGGTAPTNMNNEAQIVSAIQTRATAANTLRIGDVVLGGGLAGFGTDIKSSCSGKTCTVNVPSIDTLTFSLNDINDLSLIDGTANLVGFDSDTRAVMLDNGITFAESIAAARQDDGTKLTFQSYGGWLTGSAFGAGYLNVTEGATTTNRFTSFSFGKASGSNPTGTGRAVWTGTAVGITTDSTNNAGRGFWQADVTVDIDDLSNPNVDLVISSGGYLNQTAVGFTGLNWDNMPLTDGVFQHSNGDTNVWGSFYGDNYGEVGGTFDDDSTVGAFAASR